MHYTQAELLEQFERELNAHTGAQPQAATDGLLLAPPRRTPLRDDTADSSGDETDSDGDHDDGDATEGDGRREADFMPGGPAPTGLEAFAVYTLPGEADPLCTLVDGVGLWCCGQVVYGTGLWCCGQVVDDSSLKQDREATLITAAANPSTLILKRCLPCALGYADVSPCFFLVCRSGRARVWPGPEATVGPRYVTQDGDSDSLSSVPCTAFALARRFLHFFSY